jgi:hypothetical protein
MRTLAIALLALSALTLPAQADPGKDESGAWREAYYRASDYRGDRDRDYRRDRYDDRYRYDRRYYRYPPRAYVPARRLCRVWYRGGGRSALMNCQRAFRIADRTGGVVRVY